MTLIRVLRTAQVTLSHTFYVDGQATAPTGTLQATVKRASDGTAITGSPFTYTVSGTTCSFALPAQANLDTLTVDWSGTVAGAAITARDFVEIVGGFLFDLATARTRHSLSEAVYPWNQLAETRIDVEQEAERIAKWAFVPRFAYESICGTGTDRLHTSYERLRMLRAVIVDGVAWAAPDVAAVVVSPWGVLRRPGGAVWPKDADILVEYEHGGDYPPMDVTTAAMLRLKSKLSQPKSNIPDRAQSFTNPDGATFRLTVPDADNTGIPDVDAAYHRWGRRKPRAVFA